MFTKHIIFEFIFENPLPITFVVIVLGLFVQLFNSYSSRKRLPPGPYGLPLVGYSPFLGKQTHKHITDLGKKYGNVFTLQLGVNNVVILNDFNALKDAFSKDSLLSRPNQPLINLFTGTTSLIDDNGKVWQEHRRFSFQFLKSLGFGKGSMEEMITEEINYLYESIDQGKGKPVDIKAMLNCSILNIMSKFLFGYRFEFDDPKLILMVKAFDEFSTQGPTQFLLTCPYWLAKLLMKIGTIHIKKRVNKFVKLLEEEILKHQKVANKAAERDYIEGYLAEMKTKKEKDPNTSFTLDKLKANMFILVPGGTETSRTTCEWSLFIAAYYPEYQKKVQAEIDSIVGNQRNVTWADRLLLPYTQAFINEVYRRKTALPFNFYRKTEEDTYILNHLIPKNTLVLANLWGINNDPKIWDNPDEFNPHRFLSNDGKQLIKTDNLVQFSLGKRSCPGEPLARVEVFLYLALFLQRYTVKMAKGQPKNLDEMFGLTLSSKDNPLIVFEKRI